MSKLFKRNVVVQVGDDEEVIEIPNTFKIAFDVQKTISSRSATGTVTLYNLSTASRAEIQEQGKRVRIYAGYGDDPELLHDGSIVRTFQVDEGADRKTVIEFQGYTFDVNQATFKKAYQNGTKIKTIIADALPFFNLRFSDDILNKIPDSATIPDITLHGKTADIVDKLLQPINLQWFEHNGELFISENGKAEDTGGDEVFVLSSNTGLIKTAVKTDRGINAVCLLNAKLQVNTVVKIESDVIQNQSFNQYNVKTPAKDTEGFYKIIQASYKGDNWDGKFEALLQCVPYGSDKEK